MRGEKEKRERVREKWCFWEEGEGEGTDADALGGDFICAAFPPASGEQTSFAAVVGGTQETGKQAGKQPFSSSPLPGQSPSLILTARYPAAFGDCHFFGVTDLIDLS